MRLLIVNFHYLRNEKPQRGIYPRTLQEFKAQIAELGKYYEFLSQKDLEVLSSKPKARSKGSFCLLTIDDGLKEQLQVLEFLTQQQIPALFLVNTGHYQTKKAYEVHKLHYISTQLAPREIYSFLDNTHHISTYKFPMEKIRDEWRYDEIETQKTKYFMNYVLSSGEKAKIIDGFFAEMIPDEAQFCRDFYMSIEDLKMLASLEMLGSHTSGHRSLASLSGSAAMAELTSSRKFLEEVTGTVPNIVSYPYGGATAVNSSVADMARLAGYNFGLTMNRGINTENDVCSNGFLLKRVDTNDAPGGKFNSREYLP